MEQNSLSTDIRLMLKEENFNELISRFTNHKPDTTTIAKMADIRKVVRNLAYIIELLCPKSKEKETALTQLSFVMMSANSAIVQGCPVNLDELQEREK